MRRREFLKTGIALAAATPLASRSGNAFVPAHNWSNYDFGSGPPVTDRLNQGPFPQYPPDAVIPTDDVVMTTTPSEQAVPNYGKGLVPYPHAPESHGQLVGPAVTFFKLTYPVGYSSKAQVDAYLGRQRNEVLNIPQIVLIDRGGIIRAASGGAGGDPRLEDENSLRRLIEGLLNDARH